MTAHTLFALTTKRTHPYHTVQLSTRKDEKIWHDSHFLVKSDNSMQLQM